MLASLREPKRERPPVAVIGINDLTETTDYLKPTGFLRRADVADVLKLATGPLGIRIEPSSTRRRLHWFQMPGLEPTVRGVTIPSALPM